MDKYHNLMVKVLDHFDYIKFDKNHPWHLVLVSLYCSVVEYSDTLINLEKEQKNIAIPLVARGILEAYVDLKNLSEDQSYGNNMEASYLDEWLKVTKAASKSNNPFLNELSEAKEFETQVINWEAERKELNEKGFVKLNQFEKFQKAGMENEYRSVYNFLCSHSHNNKRALFDRFCVISEDKSDFTLSMFKESEENENDHYLELGREYLTFSSELIHRALDTGYENEFKNT